MVHKQFVLLFLTVALHIHATPLTTEADVPPPPSLEQFIQSAENEKNPLIGEEVTPDQKWILPLFNFHYAPAPTTTTPPPGPHPQVVIIPQNSTLSIVAQQPLSLVQGQAPTTFTANAPGPNTISLQTGK